GSHVTRQDQKRAWSGHEHSRPCEGGGEIAGHSDLQFRICALPVAVQPIARDYLMLVKRRPHTPNTISPALAIRHTLADSPKMAMPTRRLPVAPMPVQMA